jgi:hypothetical protein
VGNFGLFFGNWGQRGKNSTQKKIEAMDRQIQKNPGSVVVLAETTKAVEELLGLPPEEGDDGEPGLRGRSTREHYVVRGNEDSAVLIASRKDVTTGLESLWYECYEDHPYRDSGKNKMARSRTIGARVCFKQNIGHLGREFNVAGAHGNCHTMKKEWPGPWKEFWDRLALRLVTHDIKFLAGDFNMSLTEVPKQLRSRGLRCDCCAWYPWQWLEDCPLEVPVINTTQRLGIDSCGIFYIGGAVFVDIPWGVPEIPILTAVAGNHPLLDNWEGANVPGQQWHCYRSRCYKEVAKDKNLEARLVDLLTQTTSRDELDSIPKRKGSLYCPYLRLKQKPMDKDEFLVEGFIHPGAHFPLCVFTKNASARSEPKSKARAQKYRERKGKGKGKRKGKDAAVAATGKGKSKDTEAAEATQGRQSYEPAVADGQWSEWSSWDGSRYTQGREWTLRGNTVRVDAFTDWHAATDSVQEPGSASNSSAQTSYQGPVAYTPWPHSMTASTRDPSQWQQL